MTHISSWSRAYRSLAAVIAVLGVVAALGNSSAVAYPGPGIVVGYTTVHDPSMLITPLSRSATPPRYVVYGTHNNTLVSEDRIDFAPGGPYIWPCCPAWWIPYSNGDVWAPDVSFHNGQAWMYYAVSTPTSDYSAVGLATSPTGMPGTFTDQGPVITSDSSKPYNAIDPNLLVDNSGNWWLTFGSYYGGIYMVSLDPTTGKLSSTNTSVYHLAYRPGVPDPSCTPSSAPPCDQIEGAFVYEHAGYYYLFASFGQCCQGVNSTYSIHVGRSSSPTGPYIDEAGTNMLNGGGTTVVASHDNIIGPGGESVVFDPADSLGGVAHDMLIYHYYDANLLGEPFLGINYLAWDANDFPYIY